MLTPPALVQAVRAANVAVLSVTDHDTVDGLDEARNAAEAAGVVFVNGIELSAYWGSVEFHILGYLHRFREPGAARVSRGDARGASVRLQAMVNRLHAMGMRVPADDVLARAQDGKCRTDPHLARAMVERGFVGSADEAFDRYLGTNRPAYVPRPDVSVAEAIDVIRRRGRDRIPRASGPA
ncbi:MAG: hypothetical protein MZW92_38545 [Comamonadaceae bacterium]|nr:hypothetical protein [Comamonadaceae bacterium]